MRGSAPGMKPSDVWDAYKGSLIAPTDVLLHSHDAEVCDNSGSSITAKEWIILVAGKYRFKFDAKATVSEANTYARIYKGAVASGTKRDNLGAGYVTFTEDLIFEANDICALKITGWGGTTICVENLRLYGVVSTGYVMVTV